MQAASEFTGDGESPGRQAVLQALSRVVDPCSIATGVPINLVDMALVKEVVFPDPGHARITLRLTSPLCLQIPIIVDAVEREVGSVTGVERVTCEIDSVAEWWPSMIAPAARAELRRRLPVRAARNATPG